MARRTFTLEMNDGYELNVYSCGEADNIVAIDVADLGILSVMAIFSNTDKTSKMVFHYGEMQTEYEGYTVPAYILTQSDCITIGMKRGETNV